MPQPDTVALPAFARPVVTVAMLAPLVARDFAFKYRGPTHALHLHDYDGAILLAGKRRELTPGTFTLSPAGIDSSYDLPRPGTHWCIHFDPPMAEARSPMLTVPLLIDLGVRRGEGIARFVHIIRLRELAAQALPQDRPAIKAAMSIACQELIAWAAMFVPLHLPASGLQRHPALRELVDYIDRNIHHAIRAATLADRVGLTQNYLARLFRTQMGSTLPAYVLSRRISAAKLLLTTTDLAIKQIAMRVGLPDAQHFNKQFRRNAGTSPTQYRDASR